MYNQPSTSSDLPTACPKSHPRNEEGPTLSDSTADESTAKAEEKKDHMMSTDEEFEDWISQQPQEFSEQSNEKCADPDNQKSFVFNNCHVVIKK